MRNSDQHDTPKSPMKVTVNREKDVRPYYLQSKIYAIFKTSNLFQRGIRKVPYFSGRNFAALSVYFAVFIGLTAAVAFSFSEPNVNWINLAGVALLVCTIILAAIVFSGLIDYRGIPVTASKSSLREAQEKTK